MNTSDVLYGSEVRFELRYRSLSAYDCDYAFPCNSRGEVDLDQLSERARDNYLYARATVGCDVGAPQVVLVH